jgi:hypothetical protein
MTSPIQAKARDAAPVRSGWCPDDDTRDNVIARRNVLAAFWAGSMLGLKGSALTAYAAEVHRSDHALPGDEDIVAKLTADLKQRGFVIGPAEVRTRLNGFRREAMQQLSATD